MRSVTGAGVYWMATLAMASLTGEALAGQAVCYVLPDGNQSFINVFSVGEVRASLLSERSFQDLNGEEWVALDGRLLPVETGLTELVELERGDFGIEIPDARGRVLRMAGNQTSGNVLGDQGEDVESVLRVGQQGSDSEARLGSIAVNFFVKVCDCRTARCR